MPELSPKYIVTKAKGMINTENISISTIQKLINL